MENIDQQYSPQKAAVIALLPLLHFRYIPYQNFDQYCQRLGVDEARFMQLPLQRLFNLQTHPGDYDNQICIYDQTLKWIKQQPKLWEKLHQLAKERSRAGIHSYPNLALAYYQGLRIVLGDRLRNTLVTDTPSIQTHSLELILDNQAARYMFDDILRRFVIKATHNYRINPIADYLKAQLRHGGKLTIADVGCSTGYITNHLALCFPTATILGIDINFYHGTIASQENLRYLQADAFRLPLNKDSVDVLFSLNTFRHFNEAGRVCAMLNFQKNVKEGGLVIIGPVRSVEDFNPKEGMMVFKKVKGFLKPHEFIDATVD